MNSRIIFTTVISALLFISQTTNGLLNLNEPKYMSSMIYKCPVMPDSLHPDLIDQSIIIVNNKTIENLIKTATIVIKNDAKIMHKVSFIANFDQYSFYQASMADIETIFEKTNTTSIQNQPAQVHNDTNLYNEDVLTNYEYNQLKNLSSPGNGIYEIKDSDLIDHEIYKCIGNSIAFTQYFSVYLVLKLTSTTSKYDVGDTIFGLESFGYLENIRKVDRIDTSHGEKIIIQTNLTQCGNPNTLFGSILKRKKGDTISSELDCSGSSSSKLYLLDSASFDFNTTAVRIGKLIPGRNSSSFAIQILRKQIIGEYVVYEGISVHHLNNNFLTKISINKKYSYKFSKTYSYNAENKGIKNICLKIKLLNIMF